MLILSQSIPPKVVNERYVAKANKAMDTPKLMFRETLAIDEAMLSGSI
jgi:hypothetical protein